MKLALHFIVIVTVLHLPGDLFFAQETPDPLCVKAESVPIPKVDLPPPTFVPDRCGDPLDLVSTSRHTVDLREARWCAFLYRDEKSTEAEDTAMDNIAGNGALAMIYAGGKGVSPNLPLAIRFACEIEDWNGDGREVGRMLEAKRSVGALKFDFDICENPTGRQMNYLCIGRDQSRIQSRLEAAETALTATGTQSQRAAFQRVLDTRKAFLDAQAAEEPNGTTGLVQTAMREEVDIAAAWATGLEAFLAGKPTKYTAEDYAKADAELNAAYLEAREMAKNSGSYDPSPEQILKAERAWLVFRDAWVAFARLRWPDVPASASLTWLTQDRTAMLKNNY